MSDERADAIAGAAANAAWTTFWHFAHMPHIERMKRALAAAAPYMAGSGEAERLRSALTRIADGDVDGVGDYSECVQLYARQVLAAQPNAERAPQPEPRQDEQHG